MCVYYVFRLNRFFNFRHRLNFGFTNYAGKWEHSFSSNVCTVENKVHRIWLFEFVRTFLLVRRKRIRFWNIIIDLMLPDLNFVIFFSLTVRSIKSFLYLHNTYCKLHNMDLHDYVFINYRTSSVSLDYVARKYSDATCIFYQNLNLRKRVIGPSKFLYAFSRSPPSLPPPLSKLVLKLKYSNIVVFVVIILDHRIRHRIGPRHRYLVHCLFIPYFS